MADIKSSNKNMIVVGINVGLLIGYTLYIRLISPDGESIIGLAFIIGFSFFSCACY